jgi:predicted MPP superfamily phosphohydrolase
MRFPLFLTVVLLAMAAACAYMGGRTLALSPAAAAHPALVWGALALFAGLLFGVSALRRVRALVRWRPFLTALSYGLFGFMATYLLYLAAADLLQALARMLAGVQAGPWLVPLAAAAALGSVLAGLATALRLVPVRRVEVPIRGLPAGLDGFRIVQISDLHLGPLVRRAQVDHILAASAALAPDLVAVTGDLVDGSTDGEVGAQARRLGALRATHGVCFVTGNHEYYSGVTRWLELFRDLGWRVLHNEHLLVEHGGARLAVAGMPDPTARTHPAGGPGPDLAQALAGVPPDAVPILLYHPPTGTVAAERAGVRLQLSGHTHGGQFFPWSVVIQRLYAHPAGLGKQGGMWIYTSVGTGFWGTPNRFLVPSELTLLVLRRAGQG